jgi:predicted nucleic acid-binding Zn ribbon protein|tara:strand:- start:441 stop:716 length:276 start_codon:yes stop_codon:yes gene_type:complete
MKRLKQAIEEAIDSTGIKSALSQEAAVVLWGSVVGETVSSVTKAERVESGVLIVKVETAVWRQELHMQKEEIINKVNKKIGTRAIREIRFI